MNITTIGGGAIGGGLARLWEQAGHTVTTLGRDGGDASDADVVLVAVPAVTIAIRRALMISYQLSSLLGTRRLFQVQLARITGIHRDIIRKLYYDTWAVIHCDALDNLCPTLKVPIGELLV
jgi:DNA-binding Xre family transcriptional regulator